MIWEVKLYVGGKVFVESVHAVNRNDAVDTAKSGEFSFIPISSNVSSNNVSKIVSFARVDINN